MDRLKSDAPEKVAVLVLGMHRSGTSALAGLLDGLGCRGPETPIVANTGNPRGYFESIPICALNDAILSALGSRWDDWRPLRPDWHLSPRMAEFHDEARRVITEEYGAASMIYLKDPRICLLLPFWQSVLADMGYRCVHLHTHRNPADVAASLETRSEKYAGVGQLIWLNHVLQAERKSRGLTRAFTSYSALLHDPKAVAEATEAAFGFLWPRPGAAAIEQIDRGLRHHDKGGDAIPDCDVIETVLAIMQTWAEQGEQEADYPRLDQISADLARAEGLFSPALRVLDSRILDVAAGAAREAAQNTKLTDLQQQLKCAKDEIAASTSTAAEALRAQQQAHLDEQAAQLQQRLRDAADEAAIAAKAQADSEAVQAQYLQEINSLVDRLIDRDKAMAILRRDASAASIRLADFEQAHAALQAESDAEKEKLGLEVARKTSQMTAAVHQIHATQRDFENSTSWRISAPVRVVGRICRRMKGALR